MTAERLDGKLAASEVRAALAVRVAALAKDGRVPGLGTILVGDDPASHLYVAGKHRDCAEVGIESIQVQLPATASAADVAWAITELNADQRCTGYIVQLPLPKQMDETTLLSLIDPDKDADGLSPVNLGRLMLGVPAAAQVSGVRHDGGSGVAQANGVHDSARAGAVPHPYNSGVAGGIRTILPCTPRGILALLDRTGRSLDGAEVCVIGRGATVGRPLATLLTWREHNATVTVCHTRTRDLAAHTRRADVIVAAAGQPNLLTADMVAPGAVVVDVGIMRVDGKPVGDVAPDVWDVAGWVTPNPGGVGPMTRAMLLANVVDIAEAQAASEASAEETA